jgi:two-component system phosphate regulon response regulator PhoB/two-component system alkaline phosphatase synthesis response regulator PhoP
MTKPFSVKELLARVKAVLRRKAVPVDNSGVRVVKDDLVIDTQKFEAQANGDKVELTSTEFKILDLLSQKPGWVYSRQQLLSYLWGDEKMVIDRTIDVHIRHLREKLGTAGECIKNVRGVGYKMDDRKNLYFKYFTSTTS